jgi:Leucine-rich repeat (LRR) protein/ankyrin repeat protein
MACRSGTLATAMAVLLSALASTHAWAASPDTQLVDAAKNGSLAEVKDALSAGARINTKSGPTALLECLGTQQFDHTREVIQLLLAHGADINAPGPDGLSAFQLVLNSWYCDEYLPLFLPLHPDFKATTKDGDGVVALAIRRGALQLARSMLDQGAPGDLPNLAGVTPLMLAAQGDRNQAWRESEYVDMAKVLLSKGADPLRTDKAGKNAADYALDNNNYDLLVLLDSKRVQSSKYDEVKKADLAQKLSAAVERDRWSKIKMIGGPKVAQIDTRGIITSLLKEGADPNAPALNQPTTIFGQALGDRLNGPPLPPDSSLIQLLLDHGANPNQTFADGNIPLALVVAYPVIFEMLVSKGADPKASMELQTVEMNPATGGITQEKTTQSIIDVAATKGTVETMRFLLDRKADFNQPDSEGMTPLLLALENGNTDVARLLIERGARVDGKSKTGQTAADFAASSLDVGLLRKLDQSGKYASLLSEYPPSPNAPVLGAWMIGPDSPTAPLRLDPDGGGILGLRSTPRAIAWKSVGDGYELSGIQLVGNFQMPMPFKATLTPRPAAKTLALELMSQGGGSGVVLLFHRPGDPVPAQSEIRPLGNPPAPGSDTASVIAEALTAHPQYLSLTQPDLTEFPAAAYQLIGLTRLNIDNTKLAVIPSQIGKFRLLQQASFRANQISMIEDGFYDLVNLTDLDLGTNRLTTVSPRLGGLTQLTNLMLDDNRIADLPDVWDKMVSLKTLSLSGNRLSKLPRTLALAPQLSVLSLNDNMLSELPEEWGKFALDYFNLSQNRFTSFPKEIWNIQIHRLEMANNEITEIPPELASESGLEELDLSGNLITTIPDLSQTHLTQLQLSNNRIKSFPADKRAFPATLRELNLSRNEITEVPDWVFDLNLQSLSLEGNPLPEETIRSAEQRVRQAYESRRLQNHKH